MLLDTIAAISTPRGEGGISIVRMSGQDSLNILEKIFRAKSKKVSELKNYSINYGHIIDNEHIVDEVLVSIMKAPNTYTREDIVEINCHGGFLVTEQVLQVVLKNGARIAEIGEFTKRAFLNGRIDLTQAEAVIDVIHGKTEKSLSLSLNQLRGDLRDKIATIKKSVLDLAAHINVVLDYPEEGIDDPVPENLVDNLKKASAEIKDLISSYDKGKIIKDGIKTAIIGKPNVGDGTLTGITLTQKSFEAALGYSGNIFIAVALFFFAFSTIIGWYFFGEANIKYLFGKKAINIYRVLVMISIFIGSTQKVDLVWELADLFNGLMVIPNLIALLLLNKLVLETSDEYDKIHKL